jgi:large subunit ribosomal protein L32
MAVPKRRTSKSKKGMRRSHHAIVPTQIQYCNRCSVPVLPHKICWSCGWSNSQGREVVALDKKGD